MRPTELAGRGHPEHLNRDAVYRILKAAGLGRLPPTGRPRRPAGTFKDDELGFVHVDVKHLPKLRTADGHRLAPLRVQHLGTLCAPLDTNPKKRLAIG